MAVMETYNTRMGGALVAKCPECGVVCASWDHDDLNDAGQLVCYCEDRA